MVLVYKSVGFFGLCADYKCFAGILASAFNAADFSQWDVHIPGIFEWNRYFCIMERFSLNQRLECFQAAYLGKSKLHVNKELEIRRLEPDQIDIIMKHYHKLSKGELEELINDGSLFGGYKDGNLIGFIGNHLEGSLGILEVFPEYRRQGYGTVLESHMANRMLETGRVPFAQIETYNEKSLALQRKLGFSLSREKMYWLFR